MAKNKNRTKWVHYVTHRDFLKMNMNELLKSSMLNDGATPAVECNSKRDVELTILYHRRFGHISAQ